MGFNSVLVDRGRVISKARAGLKVEGSTVFAPVSGQWFRCRLTVSQSPDRADQPGSPRKTTDRPSLLYALKDLDGQPVALNPGVRLEISSKQLGSLFFDVAGTPDVLRKKRALVGYQVTLRAVDVPEAVAT